MKEVLGKARVGRIAKGQASPRSAEIWQQEEERLGHITAMKATLARDALSFETYMRWYPLRDSVADFLGARETLILSHAISAANDCLICSTYFRRALIESGEDPKNLQLSEREEALVEFGRSITRAGHQVEDQTFSVATSGLSEDQIVRLVAFCGMMVATNLVNDVLRVQLDENMLAFAESKGASES